MAGWGEGLTRRCRRTASAGSISASQSQVGLGRREDVYELFHDRLSRPRIPANSVMLMDASRMNSVGENGSRSRLVSLDRHAVSAMTARATRTLSTFWSCTASVCCGSVRAKPDRGGGTRDDFDSFSGIPAHACRGFAVVDCASITSVVAGPAQRLRRSGQRIRSRPNWDNTCGER